MKTAEWQYLTFDPAEKKDEPEGDRYREVTLPAGMENWFAPDFDAAKAGWKTGAGSLRPEGWQTGGADRQLQGSPLRLQHHARHALGQGSPAHAPDLRGAQVRRRPPLPHRRRRCRSRMVRRRLRPLSQRQARREADGGYYKSGGDARGAFVFNDLLPEFSSGKVTIAVKGFLRQNGHRGKAAPPSGHMSVWMESAKLPPVALEMAAKAEP